MPCPEELIDFAVALSFEKDYLSLMARGFLLPSSFMFLFVSICYNAWPEMISKFCPPT
jgi:hypothetical protein